jgi:hypothetical protein
MKKNCISNIDLISPCGMNCAICGSYLSNKNDIKSKGISIPYCSGCRPRDKKCAFLKKRCDLLMDNKVRFCYKCKNFPCDNLQRIDKRYRTLYRMSMIENLKFIEENGIEKFLEKEKKKWKCPDCNGTISCHNGICFKCGLDKLKQKKKMYRWDDE